MSAHAILLAAGAGRRFGGGKLVAPLRGRALVAWAAEAALACGTDGVIAVLGAEADRVGAALPGDGRLRRVTCAGWEEGLAASLRCGLAALPGDCEAVLVFLGDMPDVPPALGIALLEAVRAGAPAALPVCRGRPAHPVAIGRRLFASVAALSGDKGARALLEGVAGVVRIASDDPGSVRDVDVRGDLQ